jgi:hypothetical protein
MINEKVITRFFLFEDRSNFLRGFDCEEEFLITCMGLDLRKDMSQ